MIDTEIFDLFYAHLEERSVNNVRDQLNADHNYQDAETEESELFQAYEKLGLPEAQCKIIENWTDVNVKNAAYSAVVFRMGMQCCFSLLIQLADFT